MILINDYSLAVFYTLTNLKLSGDCVNHFCFRDIIWSHGIVRWDGHCLCSLHLAPSFSLATVSSDVKTILKTESPQFGQGSSAIFSCFCFCLRSAPCGDYVCNCFVFQLTVTKQQLQVQGKRQTPYDNVKPRVQTVCSLYSLRNYQPSIRSSAFDIVNCNFDRIRLIWVGRYMVGRAFSQTSKSPRLDTSSCSP